MLRNQKRCKPGAAGRVLPDGRYEHLLARTRRERHVREEHVSCIHVRFRSNNINSPDPAYPSKQRVLEAFADVSVSDGDACFIRGFIDFVSFMIMQVMRGSTVRGHTLGISVGNPLSVEPTLDVFNNAAYASIDFAITAARVYGIKVSSPQAFFKPFSDLSLTMISNTKVAHPAH